MSITKNMKSILSLIKLVIDEMNPAFTSLFISPKMYVKKKIMSVIDTLIRNGMRIANPEILWKCLV